MSSPALQQPPPLATCSVGRGRHGDDGHGRVSVGHHGGWRQQGAGSSVRTAGGSGAWRRSTVRRSREAPGRGGRAVGPAAAGRPPQAAERSSRSALLQRAGGCQEQLSLRSGARCGASEEGARTADPGLRQVLQVLRLLLRGGAVAHISCSFSRRRPSRRRCGGCFSLSSPPPRGCFSPAMLSSSRGGAAR